LLRRRAQELIGFLQQQPAAVTRLAVSRDCATVGEAAQRGDGRLHEPMAGLIVQVGDQPEAAAVLFEGLPVEALMFTAHAAVLRLKHVSGRHGPWLGKLPSSLPRATCDHTGQGGAGLLGPAWRGRRQPPPGEPWQAIIPTPAPLMKYQGLTSYCIGGP